jgi:hypothetical protein
VPVQGTYPADVTFCQLLNASRQVLVRWVDSHVEEGVRRSSVAIAVERRDAAPDRPFHQSTLLPLPLMPTLQLLNRPTLLASYVF